MHNSKLLVGPILLGAVLACTAPLFAFPGSDGCRTCHPSFQGGPGGALHDMHVGVESTHMTNNCQLCHSAFFDIPKINSSLAGISCIGCHLSPGLLEHHAGAGISCASCHTSWPTPASEDTAPPYYLRPDVALNNPCKVEQPIGGEDYDGDNKGLDNDGDGLYEADDPDCALLATEQATWGAVKSLYID